MTLGPIAICSRALLRIGAAPIASFDEGSIEADVARNTYAPIRDGMLSLHPWTFSTGQAALARLAEDPVADFARAFQLPPDFLRALSAGQGGRSRGLEYRIVGNQLHADADELTLAFIYRPDEADCPPFFDLALIARLAAEFCIPLTESTSRADFLMKAAETEFKRAKSADSQQSMPPRFEDFTLTGVRS